MADSNDLNFSFSGLKTAVLYFLKKDQGKISAEDVCASFEEAVVDILVQKTMKAVAIHKPKSVILSGGVAANRKLRSRLSASVESAGLPCFIPELSLTGDNAVMIAVAGYYHALAGKEADPLTLSPNPSMRL